MAEPFIGEIRMFAGNFAPVGWALCNGQLLSIAQYDALFSLIGTIYGGDGQQTFGVPDLQGRAPVHQGQNLATGTTYPLGQMGGVETVTLLSTQLPQHTHAQAVSSSAGDSTSPQNNVPAASTANDKLYTSSGPNTTLLNTLVSAVGGNQPHDNMGPSLTINFIIALEGIYPPQN
ncbi:MAG TPA: tail fiber protein [Chloroflexia bacterium]|nr:tail fiber protein [Chloroflexia bacterium]